MQYEIVEMSEFSGAGATIYSVIENNAHETLFDSFVRTYLYKHRNALKNILARLETIGKITGAKEGFFKLNEGKPGDGVVALFDLPDSTLRLYCIRLGKNVLILGGGAEKSKSIRAWQEDEKLTKEVQKMMKVSNLILQNILAKETYWSEDGFELLGNLYFNDYED